MGQCYGGISSIKIHSFLNDSSLDHIDKNLTRTVTSVIEEIVTGKTIQMLAWVFSVLVLDQSSPLFDSPAAMFTYSCIYMGVGKE